MIKHNPNTEKLWNNLLFSWNRTLLNSPFYVDKIMKVSDFIQNYSGNFLDIGMGVGNLEKEIIKRNIKLALYGVDISSKAIDKVKSEIKGNFYVSEIYKMPFKSRLFDVVAILDVLEHIYKKDTQKALKEVNRIMKRNSGLVISVPINENLSKLNRERVNFNQHVREYTSEILTKELNKSGFEVKKEISIYAFKKFYKIKTFAIKFLPGFKKPNLLVLFCIKK
ncbi:MAG TPA: class I SAM-dependent methyltransferase [Patescibacteria group bacterium]|nr:class I SAM-dependent methyltransferase [Patescibacteria group bacterium]